MKKLYLYLLIISTFCLFSCKTEKTPKLKTTVLIGEVIDRPYSKKLLLTEKNEDSRGKDNIEIPITNGKFKYTLKSKSIKMYSLSFFDEKAKGSWRSINFFNDNDTIKMTLFERDKADFNIVYGGKLNNKKEVFDKKNKIIFWDKINAIYETKFDSLSKLKQWYSKEVTLIYDKLKNEKDFGEKNVLYKKLEKLRDNKQDLTPQARVYQNTIDSISSNYENYKNKFIENDKTLFGYSMLLDNLYSNKYNKDFNFSMIALSLEKYQKKFSNHDYSKESKLLIKGIINSRIGGDYVDFSSKTNDDEIVKVSSTIEKNAATLIDLWAPWCGPCIAKSKKLKPEYQKLKTKGLEVFAVIGGINSKDKYIKARDKYEYPWQVNYELNEEFKIWDKYNISNSGGSQFLIDSKGKILAINPEPKEIDSILVTLKAIKL